MILRRSGRTAWKPPSSGGRVPLPDAPCGRPRVMGLLWGWLPCGRRQRAAAAGWRHGTAFRCTAGRPRSV